MTIHTHAPAWFHNAVVDGMQLLASMALEGAPAAEVLPITTLGWIEVLWARGAWQEQRDLPRLRAGFVSLAGAVQRWPAPRMLHDHLPPAEQAPALAPPVPARSPERSAQLASLRRRLADRLTSTPHARAVRPDSLIGGDCNQSGECETFGNAGASPSGTDPARSLN